MSDRDLLEHAKWGLDQAVEAEESLKNDVEEKRSETRGLELLLSKLRTEIAALEKTIELLTPVYGDVQQQPDTGSAEADE